MEKVISPEERIRRAEEIYYRRKNQDTRVLGSSFNFGNKNKVSLGKKMLIQLLVCICIYSIFGIIKNNNNIFSENVINKTKSVLNYDVNLPQFYNQCKEYFNGDFNKIIKTNILNKNSDEKQNNENNGVVDENNEQNSEGESGLENQNEQDSNNKQENQNNPEDENNQLNNDIQLNQDNQQNENNQQNQENEPEKQNNETGQNNELNLGIRWWCR